MLEAGKKIGIEISEGARFGQKVYDWMEFEIVRMTAAVKGVIRDLSGEDPYGREGFCCMVRNLRVFYGSKTLRGESHWRRFKPSRY